jgi:hypothetical protein
MGPDLGGGASIFTKSGLLSPGDNTPSQQFSARISNPPPLSPLPLAKPMDASGLYAIFFQDNVNSIEILTLPILPNCPVNPYELL